MEFYGRADLQISLDLRRKGIPFAVAIERDESLPDRFDRGLNLATAGDFGGKQRALSKALMKGMNSKS